MFLLRRRGGHLLPVPLSGELSTLTQVQVCKIAVDVLRGHRIPRPFRRLMLCLS